MTSLITCLSTGKGTWLKVMNLIKNHEWEKIIIITNEFGKEKFKSTKDIEFILIDENESMNNLVNQLKKELDGKIVDLEVGLNIESGSGKEHMAIISAVIACGLSIRFVADDEGKLIEITPYNL